MTQAKTMSSMSVGGAPRLVIASSFDETPKISNAFVSIRCEAKANNTVDN